MITLDTAILAVDHILEVYLPDGAIGTAERLYRNRGGTIRLVCTGSTNGRPWTRTVPLRALEPARNTALVMERIFGQGGKHFMRKTFQYADARPCEYVRHGELVIGDVVREGHMRVLLDRKPRRYVNRSRDCSSWSGLIIHGEHPLNPYQDRWTVQSVDWGLWRIREVRDNSSTG